MSSNNEVSFIECIESNKEKIYRICRVYAMTPIEPQDLFQEVVYQIWRSYGSFGGQSNIDTWVYRIALNVCMRARLKLDRNQKLVKLDAIQFEWSQNMPEDDQEKYTALRECITRLPDTDQSLVVLYLEDLSYKDISSITGFTENHIAVKMKRIREKLFECISPKLN